MLERNVVIGTSKAAEVRGKPEHFKVVTVQDNAALTMDDMGFANAGKLDFRMSPDAPVFKKVPGFAAIPFEKIGLYRDEMRPTLPVHHAGHSVSQWHQK
jgi:hypothetical protein